MNQQLVGGNYANALVDLAQEQNALEAVHSDMDALGAVFLESADVADYLMAPGVNESAKKEMIATLGTEAGFNEYTLNFLNLLVDKQRMDCVSEVIEAFEAKYCQLTDTQVRFAYQLSMHPMIVRVDASAATASKQAIHGRFVWFPF